MAWEKGDQKRIQKEDINKKILEMEGFLEDDVAKENL